MELTIQCKTYNHSLYTTHDGKIKQVVLKNAKNVDMHFLNRDDIDVDIETTEDAIQYKNNKIYIKLNDNDVSESWYGEW